MYILLVYTYWSMKKKAISIRVNPETLTWFKTARPRGYQTLMTSLLDDYVNEAKLAEQRVLGRAQELFRQFHAQCFWHYKKDLVVTKENLSLIIEGLKKHGGMKGLKLASELCP